MIIDVHAHLRRTPGHEHQLAKAARETGIEKMVLTGGPEQYEYASNDAVLEAAERSPNLFLPFAYFRLGRDYTSMVDEFHARGFHGLHFALPENDYEHKQYYLVYARAGELGMPTLFQLGILPNSGRDHLFGVRCSRMRPVFLDTVARAFPELVIIGTRLGSPWHEEACEVARCNANVYLELSGTVLKKKPPEFFRSALWWDEDSGAPVAGQKAVRPWNKILFGSGLHQRYHLAKHLAEARRDYETLAEQLSLSEETRLHVMALNAIRALGLDY
jgi:hypothetical protein